MMEIKCGRETFVLNHSDVILDNGSCVQILSKSITKGWNKYSPVIAKSKWKELLKEKAVELVKVDPREHYDLKYYRITNGVR